MRVRFEHKGDDHEKWRAWPSPWPTRCVTSISVQDLPLFLLCLCVCVCVHCHSRSVAGHPTGRVPGLLGWGAGRTVMLELAGLADLGSSPVLDAPRLGW